MQPKLFCGCTVEVEVLLFGQAEDVVVRPKWFCGCVVEAGARLCGRNGSVVV